MPGSLFWPDGKPGQKGGTYHKSQSQILNERDIARIISRISHQIIEKPGLCRFGSAGYSHQGCALARRLPRGSRSSKAALCRWGVGHHTVRDDLSAKQDQPIVRPTELSFSVRGKKIVLIDDVLFTGRTVRAAMDAVIDLGRPRTIQLAVLVDRGHRELPIRADYVGKNVPTALSEQISVRLTEVDGCDEVLILQR